MDLDPVQPQSHVHDYYVFAYSDGRHIAANFVIAAYGDN
jgi:hypothetical protein